MKFTINLPKFISYDSGNGIKEALDQEKREFQAKQLFQERALHAKFQQHKVEVQEEAYSEVDAMLTAKMRDFETKYLEEHIEQLNRMNKVDLAVIPSLMSSREYGNKELPLHFAVKEAYAINPTVAACVNVIAQSASLVPFTLRKQGREGQYSTIFKDPILNLLNNPNDTQTQSEFLEQLVMNLYLCGNCLVWKNTDRELDRGQDYNPKSPVTELIILNPDYIEYKDNGFEITGYFGKEKSPYQGNKWDAGEIIHFRLSNPLNMFWGMSPIQAAYKAIDLDSKILAWWMETLENGCRKDMLIKFKHELTDLQYKRVTNLIQNQVAGFRNGRSFMILGHEANVEFLNIAPAELDFTDSRKMSSQEIRGIFRVPGPLIGDLEGATLNNARELIQYFWLSNIMPLLNDLAAVLGKRLLKNFGKDQNTYSIGYDMTEVPAIQGVVAEKWDTIYKQVQVGVPLNIAIKSWRLQIPEIAGGDVGYMSHNLVPLGFYEDPGVMGLAGSDNPEDPSALDMAKDPSKKPALGSGSDGTAKN